MRLYLKEAVTGQTRVFSQVVRFCGTVLREVSWQDYGNSYSYCKGISPLLEKGSKNGALHISQDIPADWFG